MTNEKWQADRCYECTGYGDDWYTDPETRGADQGLR